MPGKSGEPNLEVGVHTHLMAAAASLTIATALRLGPIAATSHADKDFTGADKPDLVWETANDFHVWYNHLVKCMHLLHTDPTNWPNLLDLLGPPDPTPTPTPKPTPPGPPIVPTP